MPSMVGIADAEAEVVVDGTALAVMPGMPGMTEPFLVLEPQAARLRARADAARATAAAAR
ncbi:hypothetical protein [Streptacidiphilus sp. PAMC 29251]